jgi:phospholipid/cholesterol/gamma-HCH transport system permease protein
VQAAGFLNLFGAIDRLGGLFALIVVREFAPLVCAIVMAGVVGTSMCADLGARKIREELDALMVLGIDPVKNLVVPRFIAMMALTALLNVFALLFGTFGGMLVTLANGAPLGPFFATFFNNATVPEVAASLIKTVIFGGIIAIVCCYKGLTVKGGPEGVGRAVNQAIVISFMSIGVVNYVFTQALLASFPELSAVR